MTQNEKSIFRRAFLRTLPAGQKFLSYEGIWHKVIVPGSETVQARDFLFKQVWTLDGGAVVRVPR